jgi:hypothetical protein
VRSFISGFFEFTHVGICLNIIGIAYMALAARTLLLPGNRNSTAKDKKEAGDAISGHYAEVGGCGNGCYHCDFMVTSATHSIVGISPRDAGLLSMEGTTLKKVIPGLKNFCCLACLPVY